MIYLEIGTNPELREQINEFCANNDVRISSLHYFGDAKNIEKYNTITKNDKFYTF